MNRPLFGRVAVVTGASRGVGKGIALELGAAGATVYVTGRSITAGPLPGTVSETADQVTALGGRGIPSCAITTVTSRWQGCLNACAPTPGDWTCW